MVEKYKELEKAFYYCPYCGYNGIIDNVEDIPNPIICEECGMKIDY